MSKEFISIEPNMLNERIPLIDLHSKFYKQLSVEAIRLDYDLAPTLLGFIIA